MIRPFSPLLLKRPNYLTAMGDKNIWDWRRGEKPDAEGYFLCARVNKRAGREQIDILKGNDVKEARNCKLQWEKRNVAFAATRAEYTVVFWQWERVGKPPEKSEAWRSLQREVLQSCTTCIFQTTSRRSVKCSWIKCTERSVNELKRLTSDCE
jgi:hypothetical protein